jgi:hypothetical protein
MEIPHKEILIFIKVKILLNNLLWEYLIVICIGKIIIKY